MLHLLLIPVATSFNFELEAMNAEDIERPGSQYSLRP